MKNKECGAIAPCEFVIMTLIQVIFFAFSHKKIGTTGFEPATPCSQSKCATKLRYVPIKVIQLSSEVTQFGFNWNLAPFHSPSALRPD